jgi:hypothetical protein
MIVIFTEQVVKGISSLEQQYFSWPNECKQLAISTCMALHEYINKLIPTQVSA